MYNFKNNWFSFKNKIKNNTKLRKKNFPPPKKLKNYKK